MLPPTIRAVESLSLGLGRIQAQGWQLEGVKVALAGLNDESLAFGLTIEKLVLPEPFNQLSFVNIHCPSFVFESDIIACKTGFAEVKSNWLESSQFPFSFRITENRSRLSLSRVKTGVGTVSLLANIKGPQWNIEVSADDLNAGRIEKFYQMEGFDISNGNARLQAVASGSEQRLEDLQLKLALVEFSGQTKDSRYASEALYAEVLLNATVNRGIWDWESRLSLKKGAVYADPVFVEINSGHESIEIELKGVREEKRDLFSLNSVSLVHPGVGSLQGSGKLYGTGSNPMEQARFSLQTENLEALSAIYLEPFFEASDLEGLSLAGSLNAQAEWKDQSITNWKAIFSRLEVRDEEGRIQLQEGAGSFNWTDRIESRSESAIQWKSLEIYELPIGPSDLSLTTDANSIHLNRETRLPFLGGDIIIHRFDWQGRQGEEPKIHFQGDIQQVSLERLTEALDTTPLSGTVTGQIPGVTYQDGELRLDGELRFRMFDGEVTVQNLVSSGLFGDLPQLYGEVEIDGLDLNLITQKFEFGKIQGKLSGYIRNLYLENWKPVTFYAWLGTPEDDDSRHLISQKAVENIASIGGGGAADLVSRSFLRFFDNFGYDKLGIGCYLHNGVCQLMGMEPAPDGYYIVKGGGLPRIDVIGYNSRIDWNVLLRRLKRVSSSDHAVVE